MVRPFHFALATLLFHWQRLVLTSTVCGLQLAAIAPLREAADRKIGAGDGTFFSSYCLWLLIHPRPKRSLLGSRSQQLRALGQGFNGKPSGERMGVRFTHPTNAGQILGSTSRISLLLTERFRDVVCKSIFCNGRKICQATIISRGLEMHRPGYIRKL